MEGRARSGLRFGRWSDPSAPPHSAAQRTVSRAPTDLKSGASCCSCTQARRRSVHQPVPYDRRRRRVPSISFPPAHLTASRRACPSLLPPSLLHQCSSGISSFCHTVPHGYPYHSTNLVHFRAPGSRSGSPIRTASSTPLVPDRSLFFSTLILVFFFFSLFSIDTAKLYPLARGRDRRTWTAGQEPILPSTTKSLGPTRASSEARGFKVDTLHASLSPFFFEASHYHAHLGSWS